MFSRLRTLATGENSSKQLQTQFADCEAGAPVLFRAPPKAVETEGSAPYPRWLTKTAEILGFQRFFFSPIHPLLKIRLKIKNLSEGTALPLQRKSYHTNFVRMVAFFVWFLIKNHIYICFFYKLHFGKDFCGTIQPPKEKYKRKEKPWTRFYSKTKCKS